jgi:hypothetical protein
MRFNSILEFASPDFPRKMVTDLTRFPRHHKFFLRGNKAYANTFFIKVNGYDRPFGKTL